MLKCKEFKLPVIFLNVNFFLFTSFVGLFWFFYFGRLNGQRNSLLFLWNRDFTFAHNSTFFQNIAYINGASAEPWVRTISPPRRSNKITMGASHHFLRTFRNSHNSEIIEILLIQTPWFCGRIIFISGEQYSSHLIK